jgi:hypothetical protein
MRILALLAALVFCSTAIAQDKPAAAPQASAPAAAPAAAPATPVAVSKKPAAPMTAARKARRSEDARHCLEKASNTEVIKCAEPYL